jgi:hypothetical protein
VSEPEDLHEWISFEDPDEHRTWVFDVTFLRSNYTCIYGCGCKGILAEPAPELMLGCCSFGAHLIDDADAANVEARFEQLTPEQMQFHAKASKKGPIRNGDLDEGGTPTRVTRLADDACIFLNRPGFAGGVGCSLHLAAEAAGESPRDWKPEVCWQVPLRLEHSTDESGHVTSRLREWKRRDWGEGGDEFGWTTSSAWSAQRTTSSWCGCWNGHDRCPCSIPRFVGTTTTRDHPGRGDRSGRIGRPVQSVVGEIAVVVEGDAVLLGERGVLVVLGLGLVRTLTEPEVERSRSGLLQFSRLFESAMTTLLHDRAPTLES